jgi:hypothetical protein
MKALRDNQTHQHKCCIAGTPHCAIRDKDIMTRKPDCCSHCVQTRCQQHPAQTIHGHPTRSTDCEQHSGIIKGSDTCNTCAACPACPGAQLGVIPHCKHTPLARHCDLQAHSMHVCTRCCPLDSDLDPNLQGIVLASVGRPPLVSSRAA